MKKNILAVIFILYSFLFVYGQSTGPVDLILLLNTSSEMSSSYENVNNYITGSFLSEYLRVGDTFHLIVFSQAPRLDIARRITQRGDVETIIGRMMLQYPVENGNNPAAAITYTENYISSLPSRPKKIVLVTTGGQNINNIVNAAKDSFRTKNATFDFVQVTSGQPITNLPNSGRDAVTSGTVSTGTLSSGTASAGASASGTGSTGISTQGTVSASETSTQGTASTGVSISGTSSASVSVQGTGSTSETTSVQGIASTGETGTAVQGSQASGTAESDSIIGNAETEGTSGAVSEIMPERVQGSEIASSGNENTSGSVKTSNNAGSVRSFAFSTSFVVLIILLILILAPVIFLLSRRVGSGSRLSAASASSSKQKPKEKLSQAATPASPVQKPKEKPSPADRSKDHGKELANYAAVQPKQRTNPYSNRPLKPENNKQVIIDPEGTIIINLFVEDQSLSIGKRNTHSLKSGYSLSVGGGKSDFLIFLVPVPPNIGKINRDGSQLTFIPLKPKYFPDLGSSEVRDCLNKTIRVISDKNYEIRFRFELYEDPLLALNRVLHSIKVPG